MPVHFIPQAAKVSFSFSSECRGRGHGMTCFDKSELEQAPTARGAVAVTESNHRELAEGKISMSPLPNLPSGGA